MRRSPLRSTLLVGIVLPALALSSAGCGSDGETGGPTEAGPTLALAADTAATPVAAPTPEETARATPTLGKRFTYRSGLRVRIGKAEGFRPSPWIEREPGAVALAFTVVVVNRTGEEWNPSQLHVRLSSGFTRATQIYDAEKGIVARPEERLADRGTVRFRVAYWVPEGGDVTVEFAPGFGYEPTVVDG